MIEGLGPDEARVFMRLALLDAARQLRQQLVAQAALAGNGCEPVPADWAGISPSAPQTPNTTRPSPPRTTDAPTPVPSAPNPAAEARRAIVGDVKKSAPRARPN